MRGNFTPPDAIQTSPTRTPPYPWLMSIGTPDSKLCFSYLILPTNATFDIQRLDLFFPSQEDEPLISFFTIINAEEFSS